MSRASLNTTINTKLANASDITAAELREVHIAQADYGDEQDAAIQSQVDAIKTLIGQGVVDGDAVVNTLSELLVAFQTYAEGVNIATSITTLQNKRVTAVAITGTTTKTLTITFADSTTLTTNFVDNDSGAGVGAVSWGGIAGTLSNQTDLVAALAAKQASGDYATNTALSSHTSNTSNPHSVTKTQLGLGNVDNTADSAKPVSTAQAAADTAATAAAVSTIKGGVVTAGDNLSKLYALIQTLNTLVTGTTPDGDSVTNTIQEIVTIFATYPEGVDVATVLAGKINTTAIVNTLTETSTGKVLDGTQGKALKDLIDALTTTVSGKQVAGDYATNTALSTAIGTEVTNRNNAITSALPATVDKSFEALSYASTLSVTYSAIRPNKKIGTLTGNIAITNTGTVNGSSGLYEVTQDGTGARAVTINGTSVSVNPSASSITLIGWAYDGANYVFHSNYVSVSGGGGASLTPTAVQTVNYTASANDFVPVDTTSGNIVITLPTAPADKAIVAVKHVIQGGTNLVTVNTGGSDVYNKAGGGTAATLPLLNQGYNFQYKATGAIWYVVADDLPLSQLDLRFSKAINDAALSTSTPYSSQKTADIVNAGKGTVNRLILASDVINSNATLNTIADVTGLSFAVISGISYKFRFYIVYDSAVTTTGSRWAINGPASPTNLKYQSSYTLTGTTKTLNEGLTAYDLPAAANATSLTTGNIAVIEGIITPSTNGTVIARFASEIASSAITAKAASSYVEWEPLTQVATTYSVDTVPASGSANAIASGAVYTGLAAKQDAARFVDNYSSRIGSSATKYSNTKFSDAIVLTNGQGELYTHGDTTYNPSGVVSAYQNKVMICYDTTAPGFARSGLLTEVRVSPVTQSIAGAKIQCWIVRPTALPITSSTTFQLVSTVGELDGSVLGRWHIFRGVAIAVQAGDLIALRGINVPLVQNGSAGAISNFSVANMTVADTTLAAFSTNQAATALYSGQMIRMDAEIIDSSLIVPNAPYGELRLDSVGQIPSRIGRVADMYWQNKKICWYGTSVPADSDNGGIAYPSIASRWLDSKLDNQATGSSGACWNGTRALSLSATQAELTAAGFSTTASYEVKLLGKNADLYVFDHGYNDRNPAEGYSVGTINSTDKSTFYGAMNVMIAALYAEKPNAIIAFLTPHSKYTDSGTWTANVIPIRDAVIALAAKYSAPCLDVMNLTGIYDVTTNNQWTADTTHYTNAMHVRIAKKVYDWIQTLG